MRRSFTFVSVIVHAVVITSALIAQVLAVGPLPTPRTPLTFVGSMPIRLIDIPLPPPAPPPTPVPQAPMRLSAGMRAPRRVANVEPVYPRVAQIAHVEGVVILEA